MPGTARFVAVVDLKRLTPEQRQVVVKRGDVTRPRCELCPSSDLKYAVFWDRRAGRPLCAGCAVGQWAIAQGQPKRRQWRLRRR
jgi:hypothetical protein